MPYDERLKRLAHQIVNEACPEESRMRIGMVTRHPDGRTVQIMDGRFWGTHGVSNWWEWREVMSDGTLGQLEDGYGWSPHRIEGQELAKPTGEKRQWLWISRDIGYDGGMMAHIKRGRWRFVKREDFDHKSGFIYLEYELYVRNEPSNHEDFFKHVVISGSPPPITSRWPDWHKRFDSV